MATPLKTVENVGDLAAVMADIGRRGRAAAHVLALASTEQKNAALGFMTDAIRGYTDAIIAANADDLADARASSASRRLCRPADADARAASRRMAAGIEVVARAHRPGRHRDRRWTRPNGLTIERVRVPLGVIGIIYESRPNVTADAGALCLKAGNAAILRGGSDSFRSSRAIHAALAEGLREAGLPEDAIQLVPTRDRAAVGLMLAGLDGTIDVIVPRGGKGLVGARAGARRACRCSRISKASATSISTRPPTLDMAKSDRAQRQDAAHRRLRRRRDPAGRPRRAGDASQAAGRRCCSTPAARCAATTAAQAADPRVEAGDRRGLVDRISRRHHRRQGRRRRRRRHRPYRALRLAPHRRHRHRRRQGRGEIPARGRFAPSCCTTPRPNSPTAASSASAPRSASPPAACTRAARSASSSSPRSNTASAARGQIRP